MTILANGSDLVPDLLLEQYRLGELSEDDSARLERLLELDDAYQLDDALRWEAFYFVTPAGPFEVEPVLASARAAVPRGIGASPPSIQLRADFDQAIFAVRKENTP